MTLVRDAMKDVTSRNVRVVEIEHNNGRKQKVIFKPATTSRDSFLYKARRSKWIEKSLSSEERLFVVQYILLIDDAVKKVSTSPTKPFEITKTLCLQELIGVDD
jgi:hypothetical protein